MSLALQWLRGYVEPYGVVVLPKKIYWERIPF